jgi:hypothetical protein
LGGTSYPYDPDIPVSGNCWVCVHAANRKEIVILIHNIMILGFTCNAIFKKKGNVEVFN